MSESQAQYGEKRMGEKPVGKMSYYEALSEIQTLAGMARSGYQNDRNANRYDAVVNPLNRILEICIEVRSAHRPRKGQP